MNRVAIVGATTKLGQELMNAAIGREFDIQAMVSDPRTMTRQHESITTIQADLRTGKGISAGVSGCRYAVWAFSSRRPIIAECLKNVLDELSQRKIFKRLVFVSQFGANAASAGQGSLWGMIQRAVPGLPGAALADLSRAEALLRASQVPFVIVRPAALTDEVRRRAVVAVGERDERPGPVSRADLAEFIIGMLDEAGWDRGEFVVGTADGPVDPFSPFEWDKLDSESQMLPASEPAESSPAPTPAMPPKK